MKKKFMFELARLVRFYDRHEMRIFTIKYLLFPSFRGYALRSIAVNWIGQDWECGNTWTASSWCSNMYPPKMTQTILLIHFMTGWCDCGSRKKVVQNGGFVFFPYTYADFSRSTSFLHFRAFNRTPFSLISLFFRAHQESFFRRRYSSIRSYYYCQFRYASSCQRNSASRQLADDSLIRWFAR